MVLEAGLVLPCRAVRCERGSVTARCRSATVVVVGLSWVWVFHVERGEVVREGCFVLPGRSIQRARGSVTARCRSAAVVVVGLSWVWLFHVERGEVVLEGSVLLPGRSVQRARGSLTARSRHPRPSWSGVALGLGAPRGTPRGGRVLETVGVIGGRRSLTARLDAATVAVGRVRGVRVFHVERRTPERGGIAPPGRSDQLRHRRSGRRHSATPSRRTVPGTARAGDRQERRWRAHQDQRVAPASSS